MSLIVQKVTLCELVGGKKCILLHVHGVFFFPVKVKVK